MLTQILEAFVNFKFNKLSIYEVQKIVGGNIDSLDNLSNEFKDKTTFFTGTLESIRSGYGDKSNVYKETIDVIDEYEPYIHELLKVDR